MEIISICPTIPHGYRIATTYTDAVDNDNGVTVRTYHVEPIPIEEVRAEALTAVVAKNTAIKEEAKRRILAVAPDYKQANLTARAAELALLYPGTPIAELPDAIRAEVEAGMAIWSRIKEIREASNAIEIALSAFADAPNTTATDVAAWDVTVGWPGE